MDTSLLDGLHLLQQGQWDAAHRIAQADESDLGSWLHGIVHMAEPDECELALLVSERGPVVPRHGRACGGNGRV